MQVLRLILCISVVLRVTSAQPASAPPRRVVIAANAVFDGKGHVLHNTRIVTEGQKIVALDPKAGPVDFDLRGLTVLPGWIDAHVHITWSFGADGKNAGMFRTTQDAAYQAASNAWAEFLRSRIHGQVDDVQLNGMRQEES